MSKKIPIFPMPSSQQHYSDYGFDPQFDYFQVLEDARRHGKRTETRGPLDGLHFKLQKPISKDESRAKSNKKRRHRWWKNAFLFWKRKGAARGEDSSHQVSDTTTTTHYAHRAMSGPIYLTESSVSRTPCRSTRAGSGPLRFSPAGDAGIPYLDLKEFNMMEGHRASTASAPPYVPVYLVT